MASDYVSCFCCSWSIYLQLCWATTWLFSFERAWIFGNWKAGIRGEEKLFWEETAHFRVATCLFIRVTSIKHWAYWKNIFLNFLSLSLYNASPIRPLKPGRPERLFWSLVHSTSFTASAHRYCLQWNFNLPKRIAAQDTPSDIYLPRKDFSTPWCFSATQQSWSRESEIQKGS